MAKNELQTRIKPDISLAEPPMFKVIYFNDEVTTMEFVVESLVDHFHYTAETAVTITRDIHESGSATVAVLPYEIAEQKGIEVTIEARGAGYPLVVKVEADA